MKYYLLALKKYAEFSGRATRSEYWYFVLFNFLFGIIASTLDNMMGLVFLPPSYGLVYCLYGLAVLVPGIAVAVRRLHDVNKSGWFILIPIYNIILLCTKGTQGENNYGSDPTGEVTFDFEQNNPAV